MPIRKSGETKRVSQNTNSLLFSRFMLGIVRAFPRYVAIVGFVLFFLPQHVPTDAHIAFVVLVWAVYLLTPFLLWKLFDWFDSSIDRVIDRKK